jgi:hypothetical protein
MRAFAAGLGFLSLLGLAFFACGIQSCSGSGEAPTCQVVPVTDFNPNSTDICDWCVTQKCCAEVDACNKASPECMNCGTRSSSDPACDEVKDLAEELHQCMRWRCDYQCWPRSFCATDLYDSDGGNCPGTTEPDGGVTFADCTDPQTAVVRGTLDGKPFDQTYLSFYGGVSQNFRPHSLYVNLETPDKSDGSLYVFWDEVCFVADGAPVPASGRIALPGDRRCDAGACLQVYRPVNWCSLVWWQGPETFTSPGTFRFNLILENGDQLTGCARP